MKLAKPVGTKTKLDEVFLNVAHDSLRGGRGWRLRGNRKRGNGRNYEGTSDERTRFFRRGGRGASGTWLTWLLITRERETRNEGITSEGETIKQA